MKQTRLIRGKFADERYLGAEPDLSGLVTVTRLDLICAYNWYHYFLSVDDAKEFAITFLTDEKVESSVIKNLNKIDSCNLKSLGWAARIMTLGAPVDDEFRQTIIQSFKDQAKVEKKESPKDASEPDTSIVRISKTQSKLETIIGDLECEIDKFVLSLHKKDVHRFRCDEFLRSQDVTSSIAKKIMEYYAPLYSEIHEALNTKNEDLKFAYGFLSKPKLKAYSEFIKSIIQSLEQHVTVTKVVRKKKVKPPAVVVSKLNYKEKDDDYKISSIDPTAILGCSQLWVFNTKYRNLTVYNSSDPLGLGVKGSTLTGWDEKTSITKKIRKPETVLTSVQTANKTTLKKILDSITAKPSVPTGRINTDVLLLKFVK